ncbi:Hypothetical predicted protein [Scomber scombrus]|uniref:Uncharacterized protein n=1 Tax=Scomber scombrus TaxID=13677 RepID=A0AAV1QHJ6_SCOSC
MRAASCDQSRNCLISTRGFNSFLQFFKLPAGGSSASELRPVSCKYHQKKKKEEAAEAAEEVKCFTTCSSVSPGEDQTGRWRRGCWGSGASWVICAEEEDS